MTRSERKLEMDQREITKGESTSSGHGTSNGTVGSGHDRFSRDSCQLK